MHWSWFLSHACILTFHRRPMQMSMRGPSVWTAFWGAMETVDIQMNIGIFKLNPSSRIWEISAPEIARHERRSSNRFQGHRLSPHQRADTTARLGRLLRWFFGGWHPIAASCTGGESMFSFGSKNLEGDEDGEDNQNLNQKKRYENLANEGNLTLQWISD